MSASHWSRFGRHALPAKSSGSSSNEWHATGQTGEMESRAMTGTPRKTA